LNCFLAEKAEKTTDQLKSQLIELRQSQAKKSAFENEDADDEDEETEDEDDDPSSNGRPDAQSLTQSIEALQKLVDSAIQTPGILAANKAAYSPVTSSRMSLCLPSPFFFFSFLNRFRFSSCQVNRRRRQPRER